MHLKIAVAATAIVLSGCAGGDSEPTADSGPPTSVLVTTAAPGSTTSTAPATTTTTLAIDAVRQESIEERRRLSDAAMDALVSYSDAVTSGDGPAAIRLVTGFTLERFE